jgi:hypothetical protein
MGAASTAASSASRSSSYGAPGPAVPRRCFKKRKASDTNAADLPSHGLVPIDLEPIVDEVGDLLSTLSSTGTPRRVAMRSRRLSRLACSGMPRGRRGHRTRPPLLDGAERRGCCMTSKADEHATDSGPMPFGGLRIVRRFVSGARLSATALRNAEQTNEPGRICFAKI